MLLVTAATEVGRVRAEKLLDERLRRLSAAGVSEAECAFLVRLCGRTESLPRAHIIHGLVAGRSSRQDGTFLANLLVQMYGRCGCPAGARRVFDRMPPAAHRGPAAWAFMIAAYARNRCDQDVLCLFHAMRHHGVTPNKYSITPALSACARLGALEEGRHLHHLVAGFHPDTAVQNALITMYGKCGCVADARRVFNGMQHHQRDVVSWTAMIAAYAGKGHGKEALDLFQEMTLQGLKPNKFTFLSLIHACTSNPPSLRNDGTTIHHCIVSSPYKGDADLDHALVVMYGKCGSLENAQSVFESMHSRSVIAWTAVISAFARNRQGKDALDLFRRMGREGVKADKVTFLSVLEACASEGGVEEARRMHERAVAAGWGADVVVATALIDMYGKCGSLEDARDVFDVMPERDVIAWNCMIAAYARNGAATKALEMYGRMELDSGVSPDNNTFSSVLSAYGSLGLLASGRALHEYIERAGFKHDDVVLDTALVDMYGHCGSLAEARAVFDRMCHHDAVARNTMIEVYARNGDSECALNLFSHMQGLASVKPDHATFTSVLNACGHTGSLDKGWEVLKSVTQDYHLESLPAYCVCMVNLLGRAGRLDEAEELMGNMLVQPSALAWKALLNASRIHGDVELAMRAAAHISELQPDNPMPYLLLAKIYAAAGWHEDAQNVKKVMEDRKVKRYAGCSWIEVGKAVHVFRSWDASHPRWDEIHSELRRLAALVMELGYVPNVKAMLLDIEDEQKEDGLWFHSEKLAIAFGLVSTPSGTPLLVIKNLRMCLECHATIKLITSIVKRKISLRDTSCFHHFEHGACSCGDYW